MEALQTQVTQAIKQARYNLKDGQMKPEDETTLKTMQADIDQKIADLQGIRKQIASFNLSIAGHYS
ncbi:hypothetical protein HMY34_16985 [Thiothrix subterranea]|uniref:hypothetical protein n=1 Tax=Thiothrix subterranea TaxID=2735563 RepID=UPI00192BCFBE|nr:hypothetical protein [Thiothrix subterranea]QQZ30314.1 hypothetical protein HMY34_16985 [Thiothrix subterranea]